MRKVIAYVIVGIAFVFAASILFLVLSPTYDAKIVRSESMTPALEMGDVAIMRSVSDIGQVQPGMIIGFVRDERSIAHRVVAVEEQGIQTKGDALEDVDPWLVPLSDVEGVLMFKVPYFGYVSRFARTPLGWVVLIVLPALVLIAYLVVDIFRRPAPQKAPAKGAAQGPARPAKAGPPGAARPGPAKTGPPGAARPNASRGVKPRAEAKGARTDKPKGNTNLH